MLGVIITGSTRGVVLTFTEAFLRSKDKAIDSSRKKEYVEAAVQELKQKVINAGVFGIVANVVKLEEVNNLKSFAKTNLAGINIFFYCRSESNYVQAN